MKPVFETDIDEANRQVQMANDRAAALYNLAKAMGSLCFYRKSGFCLVDCPGLIVCDVSGLHMLPYCVTTSGHHPNSLRD
jgi:hypothetical protein